MTKMIFGTVVAVGIVSGAIAAWHHTALSTAQARVTSTAEASVVGIPIYELQLHAGKLPEQHIQDLTFIFE